MLLPFIFYANIKIDLYTTIIVLQYFIVFYKFTFISKLYIFICFVLLRSMLVCFRFNLLDILQ